MPENMNLADNQHPKYTYKLQLTFDADVNKKGNVELTDLAYMTIEKYNDKGDRLGYEIFALGSRYSQNIQYSYSANFSNKEVKDEEKLAEGIQALDYVINSGRLTNINFRAYNYDDLKGKQVDEFTENLKAGGLNNQITAVKEFLEAKHFDQKYYLKNGKATNSNIALDNADNRTIEEIIDVLTDCLHESKENCAAEAANNNQQNTKPAPVKKVIKKG